MAKKLIRYFIYIFIYFAPISFKSANIYFELFYDQVKIYNKKYNKLFDKI